VAVVSDHGYVNVDHAFGPNAAFKQAGLIEIDARGRMTRWQAYSHGTGGSSFVYVKDRSDRELLTRVRALLDSLASDSRTGIARILDRGELAANGADPEAAFAIAMRPGYSVSEEMNSLFGEPYIRAMHGYPPTLSAMNASLIVVGPGLDGIGNIGTVRLTQVAPTLASLLGLSLSPKADTPIERIVAAARR
jgi:hypothetical protein